MKILKWIVLILGLLIVVFLIYSASQDNQLKLEESITIDAPRSLVFEKVIDFQDWKNWSAWSQLDPEMEQEFSEKMGEVGSSSKWKSKHPKVGNGQQEVIEIREDEYMKVAMQFEGMDGTAHAEFILSPTDSGSHVRWTFIGAETPFYLNFVNGLMEPMLRDSYQKSLAALKEYIEAMPDAIVIPEGLEIVELDEQAIISILDSTDAKGIGKLLTELYTELSIYAEINEGIQIKGMPLAIYHQYSEEKVVLEAAMPVEGSAATSGRVKFGNLAEGKAIMGIHYGESSTSEDMHYLISDYAAASNSTIAGAPWEVYANKANQKDSAIAEIHIYYPISD